LITSISNFNRLFYFPRQPYFSTMPSLASIAILVVASIPSSLAFSTAIRANVATRSSTSTALHYHPTSFNRAVDCATTFGTCSIDELVELAEGESWQRPNLFLATCNQVATQPIHTDTL